MTRENIFQRILNLYSGINFNITKHALYQRIYRFIKRSNYSIRRGSHIGQMLPDNTFDLITVFLNEIYKKRKISCNKELDLDCIVNLDETAITLNMPPKNTIQNKGDKTVMIKTYGQEKERVSIILAVSALGSKLPPLLIFKGKNGGRIEKNLNQLPIVKNKNIFILCNENAWCTQETMKYYYENIWDPYVKRHIFCMDNCLLIYDKAPMHVTDEIRNLYTSGKKQLIEIPNGLTSIIQPLDVSINFPFKNAIRNKYINFIINNNHDINNIKVGRIEVINWINEVWYDYNIITKNMIFKSFKETGISINLNGSDKSLNTSYQRALEHMAIKDPETLVYDEEINLNYCSDEEIEVDDNIE